MINKVILMGRLCADPELRNTQSGIAVLPIDGNPKTAVQQKQRPESGFYQHRQLAAASGICQPVFPQGVDDYCRGQVTEC